MSNPYDITRHIDYTNHMRDYIKKSDAKLIIDNLRSQISKVPLQAHPDYPAFLREMQDKTARALSALEQELRRKTQIQDITQHPGYPALVKYYENKVKRAAAEALASCPTLPSCPKCPTCPTCPSAPACPQMDCPKCPPERVCPKCSNSEFTVSTIGPLTEPVPATNYPPLFVPSGPVFKLPWT